MYKNRCFHGETSFEISATSVELFHSGAFDNVRLICRFPAFACVDKSLWTSRWRHLESARLLIITFAEQIVTALIRPILHTSPVNACFTQRPLIDLYTDRQRLPLRPPARGTKLRRTETRFAGPVRCLCGPRFWWWREREQTAAIYLGESTGRGKWGKKGNLFDRYTWFG